MGNLYDHMQSVDDYCEKATENYIDIYDDETSELLVSGSPDRIRCSDYVDYRTVSVSKYPTVTIIYARCPW